MALDPDKDVLVRSVMHTVTGLPADYVVNDWAFHVDGGYTDADLLILADAVNDFFNTTQASTLKVAHFISDAIDRGATHDLAVYRIQADGTTDVPAVTVPWLGPAAVLETDGLPTEISAVLSFHAELTGVLEESGASRPRARRRGRVFIGPLSIDAIAVATPPYMLTTNLRTTLQQAAVGLMDGGFGWSVWSRTDAILRPIVGGWTDDAPDIQRRRGPDATNRTTFG